MEASYSDHLPIFLDPARVVSSPRNKKFRFENNWLRESDCIEIVMDSWVSSVGMPLQNKIDSCGSAFFVGAAISHGTFELAFWIVRRK